VVHKSVGAGTALVQAAAAAHAGTLLHRAVRFAGDNDHHYGGRDDYEDEENGHHDMHLDDLKNEEDEEEEEEEAEWEALETSLGPTMYEWCTGSADPEAVKRLTVMTDRINTGLSLDSRESECFSLAGSRQLSAAQPNSGGRNGNGGGHTSLTGRFALTDRDAMGILMELDHQWSTRVNMEVLEATHIAHAVASLAVPSAGLSAEVAGTAQRQVVRWREKMEQAVAALEDRVRDMKEERFGPDSSRQPLNPIL